MPKKIELKTQANKRSVSSFINAVENKVRKDDAKTVLEIMKEITGEKPVMWGESIIGFGQYKYTNSAGHVGEFLMIGFSPRASNLTLYVMPGYSEMGDLMEKLGPHKRGAGCLYIKKLSDIHLPTLKKIIKKGYVDMKKKGDIDYRKIERKRATKK